MTRLTEPLRLEHQDLYPHIEQLKTAANQIGRARQESQKQALDEALDFLRGHLLVHAQAEETALYPVVARLLGGRRATLTMQADHKAIRRLTGELEELTGRFTGTGAEHGVENDLRRVLYGLYSLVGVHFAKEEEVYLPLLDEELTQEEGREMFERLEEAAEEAHQAVHA